MAKTIYLTIDDSPTSAMKQKVDYLKSKKIPAILFCIGENIEKHSDAVVYAVKKGFIIGNHSYSHPSFSRISTKKAKEEIKKTDELIDKICKKAKVKRPVKVFRFPYGDKGVGFNPFKLYFRNKNKHFAEIQKYLKKLGYKNLNFEIIKSFFPYTTLMDDIDVFWTFDVKEYLKTRTLQGVLDGVEKIERRKGNEIVVVHDHPHTNKIFPKVIDRLEQTGFHFKLPNF